MKTTHRFGAKSFSILNYKYKTPEEIVRKVKQLGALPMRKDSHGYDLYGPIAVVDAATKQVERFETHKDYRNAAIMLMDVVLAANRSYNKQVEGHINKIRRAYPELNLQDLSNMIADSDYIKFKEVWGHADKKKFDLLRELVKTSLELPTKHSWTDYDRLHNWAINASLPNRAGDSLGRIHNLGIAIFQHLRIVFGVDTVKPDQRVREVLDREYGARLSPEKSIMAVEQIARYSGLRVLEVDQIFVKYGSGYYVK